MPPAALAAIKAREEKQTEKPGKPAASNTKPKTPAKGGRRNG